MKLKAQAKLFVHHPVDQEVIDTVVRAAFRTGWDVMQPATSRAPDRLKCACVAYRGDNHYCQWHSMEVAKAISDYGLDK